MTVKELIKELKKMPPDARVFHLWDSAPRTAINYVYISKSGHVITCAFNETCSEPEYFPIGSKEKDYWKAPDGNYNSEDELDY